MVIKMTDSIIDEKERRFKAAIGNLRAALDLMGALRHSAALLSLWEIGQQRYRKVPHPKGEPRLYVLAQIDQDIKGLMGIVETILVNAAHIIRPAPKPVVMAVKTPSELYDAINVLQDFLSHAGPLSVGIPELEWDLSVLRVHLERVKKHVLSWKEAEASAVSKMKFPESMVAAEG